MGAQLAKPSGKIANRKAKSVRSRLQKLRKNRTDPLFDTASQVSLDKCESLIDINAYHQFTSPSYLDLYQRGNSLQVDERPEDWIRAYKDIKNKVHACGSERAEWRDVQQELAAFVADLAECDVWELRGTLLEKAQRLDVLLQEKRPAGELEATATKEEAAQQAEAAVCLTSDNLRKMRLFEAFVAVSCRLDAVRFRMVEYYGDDQQPEYGALLDELAAVMRDVRAIKHGGALHAIVTREEYEDYIAALQARFLRLVAVNMKQAKTTIFSGGMARTARIRRSNSNVSLAD